MKPESTRMRTLVAGAPLICVASLALLAAPSAQTQPDAGSVVQLRPASAGVSGDSATVSDVVALAVASSVTSAQPSTPHGSPVAVSDVVMVVNDDGSATLSATFEGRGDEPLALKSVHIASDAGELDVASTQMWLPILSGKESRAGDASDAGGFVVPGGLDPGQTVHVQFQFDNETCVAVDAQAVLRSSTHDEVFPTNGLQLGPAKATSAKPECAEA